MFESVLNQYNTIRNTETERDNPIKIIGKMFELCVLLNILNNIYLSDGRLGENLKQRLTIFFTDIVQTLSNQQSQPIQTTQVVQTLEEEINSILLDQNISEKSIIDLEKYLSRLEEIKKTFEINDKTKLGPFMKNASPFITKLKSIIVTKSKEAAPVIVNLSALRGLLGKEYLNFNLDIIKEEIIQLKEINEKYIKFIFKQYKDLYNNEEQIHELTDIFIKNQCYENIILNIGGTDNNYIQICTNIFTDYIKDDIINFDIATVTATGADRDKYQIFINHEYLNKRLKIYSKNSNLGDEIQDFDINNNDINNNNYEVKNTLKQSIETINRTIKKPLYTYSITFLLSLIKLLYNIYITDNYFKQNSEGYGIGTMITYIYIIKYFSENIILCNKKTILSKIYNTVVDTDRSVSIKEQDTQFNYLNMYIRSIKFVSEMDEYYLGENFNSVDIFTDRATLNGKMDYLNSLYYTNFVEMAGYINIPYKRFDGWADCTETAIRNLINTLIYDITTNEIKPQLLPETMIQEFKDFFIKNNLQKQIQDSAYIEWRILFNKIIKIRLREYLISVKWSNSEFENKVWHYDHGEIEYQDMKSDYVNFTNVLSLIMNGLGYMNQIIADKNKLTNPDIQKRCSDVVREIINNQLTRSKSLFNLSTVNLDIYIESYDNDDITMYIKYFNYTFYSRIGHSDLMSTDTKLISLMNANNLMSVGYKKIYQLTIYDDIYLNKLNDSPCLYMFKNLNHRISLFKFNHNLLKLIDNGNEHNINDNEFKKFGLLLKYSYKYLINMILHDNISQYIVQTSIREIVGYFREDDETEFVEVTFNLLNDYTFINIILFDTFIEYCNMYKYIDDIIQSFIYTHENKLTSDFHSINNIILKMKRLTLNLHKTNKIFKIFNFSYSQNSVYIINQLLCLKNIAKYHVESGNLDKFNIIIDKIINENVNNIENLIKCISFYYTLKNNDDSEYDLDKIIFETFINKLKVYKFSDKIYNFDIIKLLENFAGNIVFDGGIFMKKRTNNSRVLTDKEINIYINNFELIQNVTFGNMIYHKPVLTSVEQINIVKEIILNINLNIMSPYPYTIYSEIDRKLIKHYCTLSDMDFLVNLPDHRHFENKNFEFNQLDSKYNNYDIDLEILRGMEDISIDIMENSILSKRNIISSILNKILINNNPDNRPVNEEFTNLFKQKRYGIGDHIVNVLYFNQNIDRNFDVHSIDTYLDLLRTHKNLILYIHRLITNFIAIYAKYIITEILSVQEENSPYKFYNSNTVPRDQLETKLHNVLDNILNANINLDLHTEFNNNILKFSKEYKPDIFPNITDLASKLLSNNSHINVVRLLLNFDNYQYNSNILQIITEDLDLKINEIVIGNNVETLKLHYFYQILFFEEIILTNLDENTLFVGLSGGNSGNKYYSKYLKYKQKYMMLKNQLIN